jgi:DNA replication protein DnaC
VTTLGVLPVRYAGRGLGDLEPSPAQRKAIDLCHRWLDEAEALTEGVPHWGIALAGDPGVGKTAIACAMAHDAMAMGIETDFSSIPDLRQGLTRQMDLMTIIQKFDRVDDDTPEVIEHRTRSLRLHALRNTTPLFVIDDLGRELQSQSGGRWIEDQVDTLIRHRGDRGLPMVITTNLTKQKRAARYGEALESYLHDVCEFVGIEDDDWRRRK